MQRIQRHCMSLELAQIVLSGAVRGIVLVEIFTSAVWWVNESLSY